MLQQHVGGIARQPIWVFGIVDTSFQPARGYTEIDEYTEHETGGKFSYSFGWIKRLQNLPQHVPACILHNTVNHTYNFVDPNTGAHTQVSKSREVPCFCKSF